MNKLLASLIAGIAVLMLLIFIISSLNTRQYYINATDGAIEIWQGKFAPLGRELLITLPGGIPPESIKANYAKEEVFPLICTYYLEKSAALLDEAGLPDFEIIKSDLNKALLYAVTTELKDSVTSRLNSINMMTLLYKADVAASVGGISALEEAANYLEKAKALNIDTEKTEMIEGKMAEIRHKIEALKNVPARLSSKPETASGEKISPQNSPERKTEAPPISSH